MMMIFVFVWILIIADRFFLQGVCLYSHHSRWWRRLNRLRRDLRNRCALGRDSLRIGNRLVRLLHTTAYAGLNRIHFPTFLRNARTCLVQSQ